MEVAVFMDNTHPPAASQQASSSRQYEVMLDPHELESILCDLLLQVVGSGQGITGVHVDSVQRGGVPVGVLTAALASAWQGLQEQHSSIKPCLDQVGWGGVQLPLSRWQWTFEHPTTCVWVVAC